MSDAAASSASAPGTPSADNESLKSSFPIADNRGNKMTYSAVVPREPLLAGKAMMDMLGHYAEHADDGVAAFMGEVAQGPVSPATLDAALAVSLSMGFRPTSSRSQIWVGVFTGDAGDGESAACGRHGHPDLPFVECVSTAAPVVDGSWVGGGWWYCFAGEVAFSVGCNKWLMSATEAGLRLCNESLVVAELTRRPDSVEDPVAYIKKRIQDWVAAASALAPARLGDDAPLDVAMLVRRALDTAVLISMAPFAEDHAAEDNATKRRAARWTYMQLVLFEGENHDGSIGLATFACARD